MKNSFPKNLFTTNLLLLLVFPSLAWAQQIPMYVGTYTNKGSQGIYQYTFDLQSGEAVLESTIKTSNPSFLARDGEFLFAVNENGNGKGALSAFSLMNNQGGQLDQQKTEGDHPCHVVVHPEGKLIVVSNYSGGSLIAYLWSQEKQELKKAHMISFEGSSVNKERQNNPHVHSAFFDKNGLLYVSDLGTDRIYIYSVKISGDKVEFINEETITVPLGSGPRHLDFNEDASVMYSVLELSGDLAVYQRENERWILKQLLPIRNKKYSGTNGAADVKVSPDKKYVYATNRGDVNAIAQYEIQQNGLLKTVKMYSVKGEGPRNFNFSPDGNYLFIANQKTNEIVVFRRNTKNGKLSDTGKRIELTEPVCVIF